MIDGPASVDREASGAHALRDQLGPTIRLAGPVVLAELSWMTMAIVDTIMVGNLGPAAIGAVGVGGALHFAVVIFGLGLLFGLDPIVSQAFGGGRPDEGRRALVQAFWLSAIATPPMIAIQFGLADRLGDFGVTPEVVAICRPYLKIMAWSTGPLMIFSAIRRFFQAEGVVRPALVAMVSANLVNWLGNWLMIRGRFGFPAIGVDGSGWSTTVSRVFMASVMIVALILRERKRNGGSWRPWLGFEPARLAHLVRLGLPAAVQITLEIGVFAVVTTLAGRLDPASLAAHQVVLNVSSLTFMVPLGISTAAAVRVGQALGRGDPAGAAASGWAAIGLGLAAMGLSGVILLWFPNPIAGLFTDDPPARATAVRLLLVAAGFQLFDGMQVVTTGVLRGVGDTKTPMLCNIAAHWVIGLPIAAYLGLGRGWGVVGLWVGLSSGLIAAGIVLLAAWTLKAREMTSSRVGIDDPLGSAIPPQ